MRLLVLAALLVAPAAYSAPARPAFDGSRTEAPLPEPQVPEAQGKPVPPAKDLVEAGKIWGNAAQKAKLAQHAPPPDAPFTVAVIGDMEEGRFPWERVFSPGKGVPEKLLALAQARGASFVVQLGDFVSLGTEDNYRKQLAFLDKNASLPYFSLIGNHDRSRPNGDADKTLYTAVFGAGDFYFDHGGWRFIALDTSDRALTAGQAAWLSAALAAEGPKLIFMHVPPDFIKKKLKSCGIRPGKAAEGPESEGYLEDFFTGYFDGALFEQAVRGRGVRAVYAGHVHSFGVAEHEGVRYVVTGGGGSPLYPLPPGEPQCKFAHMISAELSPSGLSQTAIEPDGSSFPLP